MKPTLLFIIIALLFTSGCATTGQHNDDWFGEDKAAHFFVSCVVAGAAAAASKDRGMDDGESFAFAMGITISMGGAKEAYDLYIKKTYWSWKDMTWDLLGALAGYSLVEAAD